jgi:hypothetical protein
MTLRDIPPDAVGISWAGWQEQQRERIFAEARERRRAAQLVDQVTQDDTSQRKERAVWEEQLLLSR